MKRAMKQKSGVYAYLDRTKVLEMGSEQDIVKARNEYWKTYKAQWRKQQRLNTKQYTIAFTPQEEEIVLDASRKHKLSTTKFIKKSCQSYIDKRYLPPDILAINSIRQQLAMNYIALQKLFDENAIPYQAGITVMQQMSALEHTVLVQLHNPKTLEQCITEAVSASPEYKGILIALLNKL